MCTKLSVGLAWIALGMVLFACRVPEAVYAQPPTEISAFHRSGQTFLTWRENNGVNDEFYRVYRHSEVITESNLASAKSVAEIPDSSAMFLTERWMSDWGLNPTQQNFIITDLGSELEDNQGLFVFTPHEAEEGTAFYAVTTMVNGAENRTIVAGDNSLTTGVVEIVDNPEPVLVWQSDNGLAMVYTQFMDFREWNPTFTGYAYNYFLSLPVGYDPGVAYPLILHIEGHGSRYVNAYLENSNGTMYEWQAIQIWGDDPHQSWYYGFSKDHNYGDNWPQYTWGELSSIPTAGEISNFTEHRLLRSIHDVIRDARYNVDDNRIYAYGHSMGGSGSLALAMRYPDVFAAVFCSEPMTNYAASTLFIHDVEQKLGEPSLNLPIVNEGSYSSHLAEFDGAGVWDWQNHQQNMLDRQGDEMAFIHTYHGTLDNVIAWETQGEPWQEIMSTQARRGWQGAALMIDHTWWGFLDTPNFSWGEFRFRKDSSFPAFTDFSLNLDQEDDLSYYNCGIEWSCSWNDFAGDVIDTPGTYEIVLRLHDPGYQGYETIPNSGTVDITPRRFQRFIVAPGEVYTWENIQLPGSTVIERATVQPDEYGLLTMPGFTVTKDGNQLRLTSSSPVGEIDHTSPNAIFLGRSTPNPFRSKTVIEYYLPDHGSADIRIHNLGGKIVRTLLHGNEGRGRHSIIWDGRDELKRLMPSGLYICQLQTSAGQSTTEGLLLLR